jgi:hypothetical protein
LNLNLTNLKDLEYICQLAADYFEPRYGMPKETEWLTRIGRYRQLIQGEIYRLEAEASRRVREDLILPPEMDQERTEKLMAAILVPIKENFELGPSSPDRVFEALNALAAVAALVIHGCDDARAREFFEKAFEQNYNGFGL